jgi:hypothetical protein
MRMLVLVTGEYGWRHVEHISQYSPPTWQIEAWKVPKILPAVIDEPDEFLPESLPDSDLILALTEIPAAAQLLPDIAHMTGARAVLAPIDNVSWLPVGLARQVWGWLAQLGVACVAPRPFCSLTDTHYNLQGERTAYDDPVIREFAQHFGHPAFQAVVDEATHTIARLDVSRDACCGCARFVASKLAGAPLAGAVEDGTLYHYQSPCHAGTSPHAPYGDSLMNVSAELMREALREALGPYLRSRDGSD